MVTCFYMNNLSDIFSEGVIVRQEFLAYFKSLILKYGGKVEKSLTRGKDNC